MTLASAPEFSFLDAILEPLPGRRIAAGDIALFVTDTGSDKPPIVFLHGLGWTHALWRRQRERYGDRWRIIAGDNRGHGQSDAPPGPYSIEGMARDWIAALDTLGITSFGLVGFSQGSRIAQLIAALCPERVTLLVLMGAGMRVSASGKAIMDQRIEAMRASPMDGARAAAASIFSPAFMAREQAFMQHFIERRAESPIAPLAEAMRALQSELSVPDLLTHVSCPALVAVGDNDRLCTVDAASELAASLPNAACHVVRDAGHMLSVEQPTQVDALLDPFLDHCAR